MSEKYNLTAKEKKRVKDAFNRLLEYLKNPTEEHIWIFPNEQDVGEISSRLLRFLQTSEGQRGLAEESDPDSDLEDYVFDALNAYEDQLNSKLLDQIYDLTGNKPSISDFKIIPLKQKEEFNNFLQKPPAVIKRLPQVPVVVTFFRLITETSIDPQKLYDKYEAAIKKAFTKDKKISLAELTAFLDAFSNKIKKEYKEEQAARKIQESTRKFLYAPGMAGASRMESQSLVGKNISETCDKKPIQELRGMLAELPLERQFQAILKYGEKHKVEMPDLSVQMKQLQNRMTKKELCELFGI